MIKSKDKNVIKYIEKLVNDKINDNETIFYKTSKIPEGGLRATIYSKLCKMDELKLPYVLDISNDVRTVDLIKMGEDVTLDVCKIIGVFLDNAIEEAIKIKDKNITIELFIMDNLLYIDISNSYEGNLEVDKMDKQKYTTKGKDRGYGLALVKKIIDSNRYLENEKMINQNRFTQRLKNVKNKGGYIYSCLLIKVLYYFSKLFGVSSSSIHHSKQAWLPRLAKTPPKVAKIVVIIDILLPPSYFYWR